MSERKRHGFTKVSEVLRSPRFLVRLSRDARQAVLDGILGKVKGGVGPEGAQAPFDNESNLPPAA